MLALLGVPGRGGGHAANGQRRPHREHLLHQPHPLRRGVYGATKTAVNYLTEGLRPELEGDDIRVTALMPGVVATNAIRNFAPAFVAASAR